MSSSPYHIRQPLNQRKKSISHSLDSKSLATDTNPLSLECASLDSIRTDLSIGSKDVIIADQWIVLGRIGEGSFGEVFEGKYFLYLVVLSMHSNFLFFQLRILTPEENMQLKENQSR